MATSETLAVDIREYIADMIAIYAGYGSTPEDAQFEAGESLGIIISDSLKKLNKKVLSSNEQVPGLRGMNVQIKVDSRAILDGIAGRI